MTLNDAPTLTIDIASTERSSPEDIQKQREFFTRDPLLNTFADAVPDIMLILNENRQTVYCNRRLLEVARLAAPEEANGQRPGELLNCIHAFESDDGCGSTPFCTTCGALRAILNGLAGLSDVRECHVIQTPDLNALDLRVSATPYQNEHGRFTIFAISDISNEKRRESLESIFFHDILNTASSLHILAEIIKTAKSFEEIAELRDLLHLTSDRLLEEINAQHELRDAERGELILDPVAIRSVDLLRDVAGISQTFDAAYGKRIEIDPGAADVEFTSDKIQLGRVLGNMVKNGLEATAAGGAVALGCEALDGVLRFWVHNDRAMPMEVQLQVFQRSFSTKGKKRGLGTYSMKLIGERYLQGKISFTSNEHAGTVFEIRLPFEIKLG